MKRLALLGSWKRLGIQAGLLAGLGLAFVGSSDKPAKAGPQNCSEDMCSFKKPNFMIIMDYSASMNTNFQLNQTRWEAAVEAVQNIVTANNGFFDESLHMALMRFGHDPFPDIAGTMVYDLTDGQSLDVHWYDPNDAPDYPYFECNGAALDSFLSQVDPPANGNPTGIGTWTNGALLYAQQIIMDTQADHPDDLTPNDERFYANLLMTDGYWCNAQSTACADDLNPPVADDPAPTAGDMFTNMGVPTYVVAIGDAMGQAFADDIASQGGTTAAIQAGQGQLITALETVVQDIIDNVVVPSCIEGLPRIMIVLDASSSMLNVNGMYGMMGDTGWDQAREALAGANSIFDVQVMQGMVNGPVEDLVHLGLLVFGAVGEEEVLVDYGPCMKDNFAWALDPNTSCGVGCNDPWGGPPITWTFLSSPPENGPHGDPFDQPTTSHMPQCQDVGLDVCSGSGTYTHLGLELADTNAEAYRANPPAMYPISPNTVFVNILITDGAYSSYSNDMQVSAPLVDMYANDNTTTYVIGFGSNIAQAELDNMACWGSGGIGIPCAGGTIPAFDAATQQDLEMALQTIIEGLTFDPCCAFNDCSFNPEPTTNEPDPVPPPPATDSGGDTMGLTSGATTGGADTTADTTADTGALTTGPTTGGADTSGGASATGGLDDSTSGGSSNSASGSGSDSSASSTLTGATMTASSGTGGGTDTDTESGGATGGVGTDDGCGCTTGDSPRGLLGTLVLLGFGFASRRRRRA